jgi:hypothetical protein
MHQRHLLVMHTTNKQSFVNRRGYVNLRKLLLFGSDSANGNENGDLFFVISCCGENHSKEEETLWQLNSHSNFSLILYHT